MVGAQQAPAARTSEPVALTALRGAQADSSLVTRTVRMLADVFGSRVLGTPSYYHAAMWSAEQLRRWGASSVTLPSFHSGQRGWEAMGHSVELLVPTYARLRAHPVAYTAGTQGTVEGDVVLLEEARLLPAHRGALRGKVVLLGSTYTPALPPTRVLWTRYSASTLTAAEQNPDPNDLLIGYHARRSIQSVLTGYASRKAAAETFLRDCANEGVLAIVQASTAPLGILSVDHNAAIPSFPLARDFTPLASFVVANEDFGRIARLMALGTTPRLRVSSAVRFHDSASYNVNVLADITGTDRAHELVILGGHLDGHPAGTSASDNAAGVAAAMEAMRLLRAAGLRPRRTIRLTLWGGEEQGFHGSAHYVADRVGDVFTGDARDEMRRISAVLNVDNGAGRIRGVYAMGNTGAAAVFRDLLTTFRTDSTPGDGAVTLQNANQSDHELFDALNVPAFPFIQDPLGYIPLTHHTDLDVVDYVPDADLRHNALMLAYVAYGLAQRDDVMPRRPHVSVMPSLTGRVEFRVTGFSQATTVSIVGDFNNWGMFSTPLKRVGDSWIVRLDLAPGRYLYKYIVDGSWANDPATPPSALTTDGKGHAGLTVRIVPPSR